MFNVIWEIFCIFAALSGKWTKDIFDPMNQQEKDEKYMHRCLQLAANGRQNAKPNPMVGAVIVATERSGLLVKATTSALARDMQR